VFSRVFLSAVLVMSGPVSAVAAEGDKWAPYVDVEGKLGTDRNLGEVGVFVPLGQSQDSLLFGNLITRFDDQDSFEGNVGLGYREIVDGNYILGGYAFFDRRKSASDNYFNQVMAGAEFMTDVWTVRANGYFADNDLAPTSGGVVTQSGTQIFVQSNLEGALSGFDAEVGRVIPLGLEDVTLTGFAGGFHFGRSGFEDVSGPRGRAELSFNNLWDTVLPSGTQLRFGAEVQHDDVRDTQGFFSARLRVPLFGGSSSSNLSVLDQRMVDPVVRDIDVVAGGTLSAPVTPEFQNNGTTLRGANIIDADDDLGAALTAAGENVLVVVDGSKGALTSANRTLAQTGQSIVGAQVAQLILTDPTTGQSIVWRPNGVRPTLNGVGLGLPGDNTLTGIDFASGFISIGSFDANGTLILAPAEKVSGFNVSDVGFSGSYTDVGVVGGGLVNVVGAKDVSVSDLRFADVSFDDTANIAPAQSAVNGIVVLGSENISLRDISARRLRVKSNASFSTMSASLSVIQSQNISVSGFHVDDVQLTSERPGGVTCCGGLMLPDGRAYLSGIQISESSVSVANSSLRNLEVVAANGFSSVSGVTMLGLGSTISLASTEIDGLIETGLANQFSTAVSVGLPGITVFSATQDLDLTIQGVSMSNLERSLEFNSALPTSTVTLSGADNVLGTGVGGCVNNSFGSITLSGSVSFTNGSTCP